MFIFISILMTSSLSAQSTQAQANFKEKEHKFGTIKEADGPVSHVFKFTNIGNEPLVLKNVRASCGCTTPKWTREPILPNGMGEIEVTYNPRNRPGSFRKTITVTTNSEPTNIYLSISGTVIAREKSVTEKYPLQLGSLHTKKTHLSFATLSNAATKTETVEVMNTSTAPIRVSFPKLPKHIKAPEVTIPAGKEGKLSFSYEAALKKDWGYVQDKIYCEVNGKKVTTPLQLSATIIEDFSQMTPAQRENAPTAILDSNKADFGQVKRGDRVVKTVNLKNMGKSPLIVHAVKSSASMVQCRISSKKIAVGESATIEIIMETTNTKGRQYKRINIITNAPASPNLTFTLSGSVI